MVEIDAETAAKYLLEDGENIDLEPIGDKHHIDKMLDEARRARKEKRCVEFAKILEVEAASVMERQAFAPRRDVSKLSQKSFIWIGDRERRDTWYLPYRAGADFNSEAGMYRRAGPVDIGALRAIHAAIEGDGSGISMSVPRAVRNKLNGLFKKYRIGGRFREQDMEKPTGRELIEEAATQYFDGVDMDTEKMVVKNVAILRPSSKNCTFKEGKGRRYSRKARESTARLINGAKAFIDHPTKTEMKERQGVRSVRDMLGFYENGHIDTEGIVRADLHYLESHKAWFEPIVTQMGDKVGKSIHAYGPTYLDSATKEEIVEDISVLTSADLVTEPGSTTNLFESGAEDADNEEEIEVMEDEVMTIDKLTMKDLLEGNPGLVESIKSAVVAEQVDQGKVTDLETKVTSLTEENSTLKNKLDEYDVKEKVRAKEDLIQTLLDEAELPKELVTDIFKESLQSAEGKEKVAGLIEDRKKLIGAHTRTGVRGMGGAKKIFDEADGKGDPKADEALVAESLGIVIEEAK